MSARGAWLGGARGGPAGPRAGGGDGELIGARLGRAAWGAEGAGAALGETRRDRRAALPGGEARGAPGARRESAPATRGMSIPALLGRASPPTRARGVARDRLPPALPTCWPPGARLTLNSRTGPEGARGPWPGSPARERKCAPLICPAISEPGSPAPHMQTQVELPF